MDKLGQERTNRTMLILPLAGGMLSLSVSLFYFVNFGFSFEFLGPEKGSETSAVKLWSVVNMGTTLLTIALSIDQLIRYNRKNLRILMGFIPTLGVIHAPPLLLWLGIGGDLFGVFVHAATLLVLLGGLVGLVRIWNKNPVAG